MASTPQHEPTMEEILASIRKIISEDSSEAQPQPVEQRAPALAHEADADILELTQEVVEEPAPPPHEPEPEPEPVHVTPIAVAPPPTPQMAAPSPAPVEPEQDVVFEHIEEPKPVPPAPAPTPAPAPQMVRPSDSIFSESAREAVQKAFARTSEPEESFDARDDDRAELPSIDGKTIEAVFMRAIRESFGPVAADYLRDHSDDIFAKMTPLIRDWMDTHFPPLLERAVRAEVARVVDDHFPALVRSEVERAVKNRR